ncbi:MAG: hypothetical protein U0136_08360 [Bdellovibrionota bacterium]
MEEQNPSDKSTIALAAGWLATVLGGFFGWTWSENLLSARQIEPFQDLHSFWPLLLGAVLTVFGLTLGLYVISRRRYTSGLCLLLGSIFLPAFCCIWPFAVRVVQSFDETPRR